MRAVVRLDVRDDVLQHLVVERILRRVGGHHLPAGRRPAGRHHDDHRQRLLLGDQVVEDVVGAADGRPGDRGVAAAVNQIEHRIDAGALLVPGRRVDDHLAPRVAAARWPRSARPRRRRAARRASQRNRRARRAGSGPASGSARRSRVADVDGRHAVDVVGVAPGARFHRAHRGTGPDAVLPFRHRHGRRAAAPRRPARLSPAAAAALGSGTRPPLMSPPTVTTVACGASTRNVTRPSAPISGDTNAGPPRPRPCGGVATGAAPGAGDCCGAGACAKVAMPDSRSTLHPSGGRAKLLSHRSPSLQWRSSTAHSY